MSHVFRLIEAACATAVALFARLVTGVRGEWNGSAPDTRPRVYFANHRSHADFVLIWTVLVLWAFYLVMAWCIPRILEPFK